MRLVFLTILSLFQLALCSERPNVLLIYVDDLGFGDLRCYDAPAPAISSPRIDQLAAEGIRFTNCMSACCVCSPSRASVLTGRYPQRNGVFNVAIGLPHSEVTIAELLQPAGYATAAFGKWHLGPMATHGPPHHGFHHYEGALHNYHVGSTHKNPWYENLSKVEDDSTFQEAHQRLTDATISYITEQRDRPFFIYLSHYLVHGPWYPNKEFCTEEEWASIEQTKGNINPVAIPPMVRELDHHIGQVLDALDRLGLSENTIIIFASDNGPWLPTGSAGPYAGGKFGTMEGGQRVPCIIRWPAQIPAGQVYDELTSTLDVMPTLAAITGTPLPTNKKTDGYNLLPVLRGDETTSPRDDIYYYNGRKLEAYRQGDWKIHLPRKANTKNTYSNDVNHDNGGDVIWWAHAARGGSHHNLDRNLLNNVRQDQKEQVDLSTSHPEITQRLLNKVETIRVELGDHNRIGSDGPR